jgi:hypothetical protein
VYFAQPTVGIQSLNVLNFTISYGFINGTCRATANLTGPCSPFLEFTFSNLIGNGTVLYSPSPTPNLSMDVTAFNVNAAEVVIIAPKIPLPEPIVANFTNLLLQRSRSVMDACLKTHQLVLPPNIAVLFPNAFYSTIPYPVPRAPQFGYVDLVTSCDCSSKNVSLQCPSFVSCSSSSSSSSSTGANTICTTQTTTTTMTIKSITTPLVPSSVPVRHNHTRHFQLQQQQQHPRRLGRTVVMMAHSAPIVMEPIAFVSYSSVSCKLNAIGTSASLTILNYTFSCQRMPISVPVYYSFSRSNNQTDQIQANLMCPSSNCQTGCVVYPMGPDSNNNNDHDRSCQRRVNPYTNQTTSYRFHRFFDSNKDQHWDLRDSLWPSDLHDLGPGFVYVGTSSAPCETHVYPWNASFSASLTSYGPLTRCTTPSHPSSHNSSSSSVLAPGWVEYVNHTTFSVFQSCLYQCDHPSCEQVSMVNHGCQRCSASSPFCGAQVFLFLGCFSLPHLSLILVCDRMSRWSPLRWHPFLM